MTQYNQDKAIRIIKFLRANFRDDGAEGESVHELANQFEAAVVEMGTMEQCLIMSQDTQKSQRDAMSAFIEDLKQQRDQSAEEAHRDWVALDEVKKDREQWRVGYHKIEEQLNQLMTVSKRVNRGCDCDYDDRCGNCESIIDLKSEIEKVEALKVKP